MTRGYDTPAEPWPPLDMFGGDITWTEVAPEMWFSEVRSHLSLCRLYAALPDGASREEAEAAVEGWR